MTENKHGFMPTEKTAGALKEKRNEKLGEV